jgi:hypothetical protein
MMALVGGDRADDASRFAFVTRDLQQLHQLAGAAHVDRLRMLAEISRAAVSNDWGQVVRSV